MLNLILKLDPKKKGSPDNIDNEFLIRYSLWTSRYLTIIFQKSLSTSVVSTTWKSAKIFPLYKSGKKQSLLNYRPISITSHSCKILEHIIFKQIIEYLDCNNVLSDAQHGFRHGFSTITQLREFAHDILQVLDTGDQIDAIFIDFSKAFDTVSHYKMLKKFTVILKNEALVNWINSFLTNRSQYVLFKSSHSSTSTVTSGISQGSILGPLLFLIFINDLPRNVPIKIHMYADDCVLYHTIKTAHNQIILNLFALFQSWCDTWQTQINFRKTVSMSFSKHSSPSPFTYLLNGCPNIRLMVGIVSQYKYLGLLFTQDLSWSQHINFMCNRALRKLGYLQCTLRSAPD